MHALELLNCFDSSSGELCVTNFGGSEGIITIEDIVEEILSDALPRDDVDLYIEPLGDGRFLRKRQRAP